MENKIIEIPFGAKDSELCGWEYTIPEGFVASIENGKIVVKKEESEDGKIREWLIGYFNQYIIDGMPQVFGNGLNVKDIIAWLEKQGEKEKFIEKELDNIRGYREEAIRRLQELENQGEQKPIIEIKSPEESLGISSDEYNEIVDECLYDESKSADKVKSIFHEGDWIVDKESKEVFNISKKLANTYEIIDIEGNDYHIPHYTLEEKYDPWTIEDANDGDVLVEDSCIFIIQKLGDNSTAAKTYCTLYNDGDFDDGSILYFDVDSTKPATKEQRDLLFQKMKEAGYEWDAEKKELKKIEQKPAWSEEDENILKAITYTVVRNSFYKECMGISNEKMIDWLKSLKDRLQHQWKPKGIHLEALRCVINGNNLDVIALKDLLEQLKKL